MKLIFLDIDGVLNTCYTKERTSTNTIFVEDRKIAILKKIIDNTNTKIVLSSTWRIGWRYLELGLTTNDMIKDFIELRDKLKDFEIELYDKTPLLNTFLRGSEIKAYLDSSKDNIENYIIIDDMGGKRLRPCSSHLLQTSMYKGLEEKHIRIVEKMLRERRYYGKVTCNNGTHNDMGAYYIHGSVLCFGSL